MEAFLCGPDEAVVPVGVKDLGNGSYVLTTAATRPGAWTIKARVSHTSRYCLHPLTFASTSDEKRNCLCCNPDWCQVLCSASSIPEL